MNPPLWNPADRTFPAASVPPTASIAKSAAVVPPSAISPAQPLKPSVKAALPVLPLPVRPAEAMEAPPVLTDVAPPPRQLSWGQRLMAEHGPLVRRIGEVLPGGLTWFLVSAIFWGPLLFPGPLALMIIAFDLYWFSRSFSASYHAVQGYWKMRAAARTNWRAEYDKALDDGRVQVAWEQVRHVVIIPNLKELPEKLRLTVQHLADQEDPQQITVVLAMEAKEEAAHEKAEALIAEFQGKFDHIFATYHPAGIPGEVPGKSSNEAWAQKRAKEYLVDELGYDLSTMTVTSCDADSLFAPKYFSCVTYKFCTDKHRHRRFWQAPLFMYNNIWEVPMPIRVVSVLSSLNTLADLCKAHRQVFPHSTYTLSMQMCEEAGGWDVDVIPEDWHMFLKCFFALKGEVEVEPVFLPVGADGVKAATYRGSLAMRYNQAKRHAWGAEDIGYALQQCLLHPDVPKFKKVRRTWGLVENHVLWSTHWFILTLGGVVPTFLAPSLGEITPIGGLPQLVSWMLTACLGPFIIFIVLDMLVRPKPPKTVKPWFPFVTQLQWFLMPLTSAIFATMPAVEAQTQLLMGKPLAYVVTEKV